MSQPLNTEEQLQAAVDAYSVCQNKVESAKMLGIPRSTFDDRLDRAIGRGFKPSGVVVKNN